MAKDVIEKIAEAPADALDATLKKTIKLSARLPAAKAVLKTRHYWHNLGPGLTTGAADDDGAGVFIYSQTGAKYGFQFLWLSVLTFPLMAVVQEMCARIGLVTGRGLAGNIRLHFSKRTLYLCTMALFIANTFNIGADLGIMAQATKLLRPSLNFSALVMVFGLISLVLQIFTPYVRYARYLKWLALILLSYIASAVLAHLDWGNILHQAYQPKLHFNKDELFLVAAILGTTISPYLFFWQTSQEVEEKILEGETTVISRQASKKEDVTQMRQDVWSGMLLSNIVMFFIIAVCGALLFTHGITNITSATQAADALRPFAGQATYWLFAAGIIGSSLLTIPVLAGANSYAISESLHWRSGLYQKLHSARAFYGIIILSCLIGIGMNFFGVDPVKALIYSGVLNAIVAPLVLSLVVIISSNKKIMGDWTNHRTTALIGWLVTAVMAAAGIAAIWTLF